MQYPLSPTEDSLCEFWSEIANQCVNWIKPWEEVLSGNFNNGQIQWFKGGKLNVSSNCLDRHLPQNANKTALIWEGDRFEEQQKFTYAQLHAEVCRMSHVLKKLNIHKGDTVGIYLPLIPEAVIAMLACARIGAVHTVVFAGFSAKALKERLFASKCRLLISADHFYRAHKLVPIKEQMDEACEGLDLPRLIIKHSQEPTSWNATYDHCWESLKADMPTTYPPEPMDAEDPLFILYTSGSTGQPKGVVHTTGGYLVQTTYSQQLVFDCKQDEVFWCTADVGWITGHSYTVYGPLCNGLTTLIFEGTPTWPTPGRYWEIVDRYQVNVLYTAPTAIRALMREGDEWLKSSSRQSLRLLGSVGEPINPEAWQWYYEHVGLGHCPIVDTWWQTETGSILISATAKDTVKKPGSARHPLPGIVAVLLDEQGQEVQGAGDGALALKYPWPSMLRTLAGDHARFCKTYLHHGYYITGDGARRDSEGDYWITGRIDDVINVSGHRLGSAEIEKALASHESIGEAAVVGVPHALKGQGIIAFVILKKGFQDHDGLVDELTLHIKKEISAIAKPECIYQVAELPKTRSGKIMRRILGKIAAKEAKQLEDFGDLSTLANPQVVLDLIKTID